MKKFAFLSLAALTLAAATPVLAQGPNFQGNYDAAQTTRNDAAAKAFLYEQLDAAKVLVVDAEAEVARAQKEYDAKVAEINVLKAQLADVQAKVGAAETAPKAEDKKAEEAPKAETKKEAKVVKAAKTATTSKALPKTSAVK
ncbi:hypothetical protein AB6M97_00800 [Streptococcus hillyeri]|uniref:Uncharacterized protein n=1 Tax=Streptococcus hillyeri TaxID=2282420 RepID=A0A3L9DUD4_9STRE|nr:hypothetical protein [Streptococcus hillyeri]RLY02782.1 hypothetical protein EAF07_06720 [Streptococcus hillyeri]